VYFSTVVIKGCAPGEPTAPQKLRPMLLSKSTEIGYVFHNAMLPVMLLANKPVYCFGLEKIYIFFLVDPIQTIIDKVIAIYNT